MQVAIREFRSLLDIGDHIPQDVNRPFELLEAIRSNDPVIAVLGTDIVDPFRMEDKIAVESAGKKMKDVSAAVDNLASSRRTEVLHRLKSHPGEVASIGSDYARSTVYSQACKASKDFCRELKTLASKGKSAEDYFLFIGKRVNGLKGKGSNAIERLVLDMYCKELM
jgi:hypothetical protein